MFRKRCCSTYHPQIPTKTQQETLLLVPMHHLILLQVKPLRLVAKLRVNQLRSLEPTEANGQRARTSPLTRQAATKNKKRRGRSIASGQEFEKKKKKETKTAVLFKKAGAQIVQPATTIQGTRVAPLCCFATYDRSSAANHSSHMSGTCGVSRRGRKT